MVPGRTTATSTQVREARKANKPVPAKLSEVATKWDEFNEKDRELKKARGRAKDAVEKEKRNVARSVGDVDDVESLQGEVTEKQIELDLTIGGQVQPYVMTLRKYELKREAAARAEPLGDPEPAARLGAGC